MKKFKLSEIQAKAILDMRLQRLTGLERQKIEDEYKELQAKIADLRAILASEGLVRDIIKEELDSVEKNSKSERKTRIIAAEGEFKMEDLIADEQVIITISNDD